MRSLHASLILCGTGSGFILNALLVYIIRKTQSKTRSHTYMTYAVAIQDLCYTLSEVFIQHEIALDNGALFFYSHGIEQLLPSSFCGLVLAFHICMVYQSTLIIPAIFYYRLALLKNPSVSPTAFLTRMKIGLLLSGLGGILAALASRASERYLANAMETNLRILSAPEGVGEPLYVVFLWNEVSLVFIIYSTTLLTIGHLLALYYVIMSTWKANLHRTKATTKTRHLQLQFTRNLVAQTILCTLFVTLPMLTMVISLVLGASNEYLGALIYTPLAWHSCLNAFFALTLIKSYRSKVLKIMRVETTSKSPISYIQTNALRKPSGLR